MEALKSELSAVKEEKDKKQVKDLLAYVQNMENDEMQALTGSAPPFDQSGQTLPALASTPCQPHGEVRASQQRAAAARRGRSFWRRLARRLVKCSTTRRARMRANDPCARRAARSWGGVEDVLVYHWHGRSRGRGCRGALVIRAQSVM